MTAETQLQTKDWLGKQPLQWSRGLLTAETSPSAVVVEGADRRFNGAAVF